ncbi:MAG: hypothetical protein ACFFCI_00680 [Promethearchaeota archaeon]
MTTSILRILQDWNNKIISDDVCAFQLYYQINDSTDFVAKIMDISSNKAKQLIEKQELEQLDRIYDLVQEILEEVGEKLD